MAQGVTNINIIATFIHNNPGCTRTDIKRHLFEARSGKNVKDQSARHLGGNQYFQTYGSPGKSNVYLDRLWYNAHRNMVYQEKTDLSDYWDQGKDVNRPGKSLYKLTWEGEHRVMTKEQLTRPWPSGTFIEFQHCSPNAHGWHRCKDPSSQGLVINRTDTYGMWVLCLDGQQRYVSHLAWAREVPQDDSTK